MVLKKFLFFVGAIPYKIVKKIHLSNQIAFLWPQKYLSKKAVINP